MYFYQHSVTSTFSCSEKWKGLTGEKRLRLVEGVISQDESFSRLVSIVDLKDDGQVILRLLEPVGADRRGTVLLDLEDYLKQEVDVGLTVWLEPLNDKSALRKLRGIEVKRDD